MGGTNQVLGRKKGRKGEFPIKNLPKRKGKISLGGEGNTICIFKGWKQRSDGKRVKKGRQAYNKRGKETEGPRRRLGDLLKGTGRTNALTKEVN